MAAARATLPPLALELERIELEKVEVEEEEVEVVGL